MSKQAIEGEIKSIVALITGIEEAELEGRANFIDDLGIESVMAVDIVTTVETHFGIDIPVDKFGEIDSIDAIVDVVCELRESASV